MTPMPIKKMANANNSCGVLGMWASSISITPIERQKPLERYAGGTGGSTPYLPRRWPNASARLHLNATDTLETLKRRVLEQMRN
jgi:hypothetical protein